MSYVDILTVKIILRFRMHIVSGTLTCVFWSKNAQLLYHQLPTLFCVLFVFASSEKVLK